MRSNYGATSEIISQITDPSQLIAMLKNPQYAGFTNIIIARLTEIRHMQGAAQGATAPEPTVAQQAVQPQQPQVMARGGIVSFKDGGKVKKDDEYKYQNDEYKAKTPKEVPKDMPVAEPVRGPALDQFFQEREKSGIKGFADGGAVDWKEAARRGTQNTGNWAANRFVIGPARAVNQLADMVIPGEPYFNGPEDLKYQPMNGGSEKFDSYGGPDADRSENIAAARQVQQDAALPPLGPVSERDFNYPSMGGLSSFSARSMGGDRPERPLSGYMSELREAIGENTDAKEARAELKHQKEGALNNALMYAGLGMARGASTHPQHGILGNFATGATEGLTSYDKQAQERQQQLRDLSKSERAERLGLVTAGVSERGQDIRADRQENIQRAGLGLQAQSLKAPALLEIAIRKRAVDLANQDRAQGVQKPFSEYHLQATREYSPALGVAGMRSDTARQADATRVFNAAEKVQPGSGRRAVQMWESQGAPSVGDGGAGKNYGALE